MVWSIDKRIGVATLVAGTLDILAAIGLTLWYGKRTVEQMLTTVASGPFPSAAKAGAMGPVIGLLVHFVLMAIMVTVYMLASNQFPALKRQPILWGTLYGLATYVVMNLIVVPWRWPAAWPPTTEGIVTQLFCHIVLVGIPIALVARKG